MTIPVFITARLASTRLPRKHLLDLGDGHTVIEHIYLRCKHFGFAPRLCLPIGEEWPSFKYTIDAFGGDPDNVEKRLMECASKNGLTRFHHLDGDDPFFDETEVLMQFYATNENISIPTASSCSGNASVGTTYNLTLVTGCPNLPWPSVKHPWPQRLTLDYEEDYHLLCAVNRMVGGYMAPRSAVDDLFIRNPDLHRINWFRTTEWKERQLAERSGS